MGLIRNIYQILQSGVQIFITSEHRYLSEDERSIMLYLLNNMIASIDNNNRTNRQKGRNQAKESGKYTGRKPIEVSDKLLKRVVNDFHTGTISEQEALEKLSISRSTFYRKIRALKQI